MGSYEDGAPNGTTNTSKPIPLWIDGQEVTTTTTFDVTSPSTGEKLWTASSASPEQATQAVEAAQRAFKTWRRAKPAQIRTIPVSYTHLTLPTKRIV